MGGNNRPRIEWIDFTKGIAILLVIIGHTVELHKYGSSLRGIIYSFHMPLFFILSVATYRCSENMQEFCKKAKKAARHLIVPALIVTALHIIIAVGQNPDLLSRYSFWVAQIYKLIFASGGGVNFANMKIPAMGIPWFFVALFVGRTIFDYLHLQLNNKQFPIILAILGIMGVYIGRLESMPLSLDIALAILPLFYFGTYLKQMDVEHKAGRKMLVYGLIWLVLLLLTFPHWQKWSYLEFAGRRYPLFPLCYIGAIAGTMCLGEFSVLCCRYFDKLKQPLLYLGQNTMYMLCIHCVDGVFAKYYWDRAHQFHSSVKRVAIDIVVFIIVMAAVELFQRWRQKRRSAA